MQHCSLGMHKLVLHLGVLGVEREWRDDLLCFLFRICASLHSGLRSGLRSSLHSGLRSGLWSSGYNPNPFVL